MNDLSTNPYLKNRPTPLKDYSLYSFLFNEVAVERQADIKQVILAIANLVASHGFNINLSGYRFIILLVARYIVKSDYNENIAVNEIAGAFGTTADFVNDSITASIRLNLNFVGNASKTLGTDLGCDATATIANVVEILGALYKIYYNYTVVGEEFSDEYAVNYNRISINHG